MKATFVRTWVTVLIAAGLGAYAYFVESKRPPTPEKPTEKVFSFDKAKVREVSVEPKDGDAVRVVKEGEGWKMVAPMQTAADTSEVDSLVQSLSTLQIDEVVAPSVPKLADFGLATPQNTIGVVVEGTKEPVKLMLGDKTPDGGAVYAKLPTQPRVFTVAAYLEGSFNKKALDLRDRDVLHVKRDAIKSLEIAGPEGDYTLVRGGEKGEWSFTKPISTKAGRWTVDGLLGLLESLKMESVAAEEAKDMKPFGLDKPVRTVVVGLADGSTKTLQIGSSPAPKKYNARDASSSRVAVIPEAIVDQLSKGSSEFREKRLLDVATYEVEGVDVEADGTKRVYVRSSSKDKDGVDIYKWKRTAPDAKDLDTNKVQDALFKIPGVEASGFVDAPQGLEKYGLDKPDFKLTLRYGGDKPPAWLEIGRKDGKAYARRTDDAVLLEIDSAKADELVKAFKEL